jgi:hypothetical protein
MAITSLDRLLVTRQAIGLLPLVSPTTLVGAGSTAGLATQSMGFTFTFDGVDYSGTFAVRVSGYLRLAGTINSGVNSNLFASSSDVVLAPWWDGLGTVTGTGYVKTELQGTAPWRRRVVEWHVGLVGTSASGAVKFQCVLYETSGRIEFRYGPRSGTPGSTPSASIGVKGNTSVVSANRRDLWVDGLALGGSSSSATSNLTTAAYDTLVGRGYVLEPNWPMCGRWIDIPATLLAAPNPLTAPGPGLSPSLAWCIANNVHWLYCRHMPALVNISPVSQGYVEDPYYVVPVEPSQDNLTYRVEVQTYTASSGTITLDVQSALSSAPQPSDIGDWTSENDTTETVTAGYQDWGNVVDVALDRNTTFVRFAFDATFAGADDVRLLSLIMRPIPLDDFDPTATFQSGFVPMGLGQLIQSDAGYHAEWLNRAYRNIARILADRWQALWSLSWPEDTDYVYTGPSFTPVRVLGAAPASLPAVRQRVVAEVYGYDTNDGATATFAERGGRSVTLTVDNNADTYQLYSGTLDLIGETPLVLFSVDPVAQWRASFCGLRWAPDLADEDLIAGLTPAPRHEYLATLVTRLEWASRAWSVTGLAVRLERTNDTHWVLAWVVPPAVRALWPLIARCDNGSGSASPTEIFADTSGSGASDEVLVPSPLSTRDAWPPDRGTITVAVGSQVWDATPAAAGDRLLESPTSGDWSQAEVETARVTYGVGMTLVPLR